MVSKCPNHEKMVGTINLYALALDLATNYFKQFVLCILDG